MNNQNRRSFIKLVGGFFAGSLVPIGCVAKEKKPDYIQWKIVRGKIFKNRHKWERVPTIFINCVFEDCSNFCPITFHLVNYPPIVCSGLGFLCCTFTSKNTTSTIGMFNRVPTSVSTMIDCSPNKIAHINTKLPIHLIDIDSLKHPQHHLIKKDVDKVKGMGFAIFDNKRVVLGRL